MGNNLLMQMTLTIGGWLDNICESLKLPIVSRLNSYFPVRKKDDSDVATGGNYGVASFSSWSKSTCNFEMGITRIRGRPDNYCFLDKNCLIPKVNTLNMCGHAS